jgi:maltooligosyltrehalose trehalohydrolase
MPEVSVWAPSAHEVALQVVDPITHERWTQSLTARDGGWFAADVDEARPGRDYGFLLDGAAELLPDPRSRRQPTGVHGPSRFYADDFRWTDTDWTGHALPDAVFYELHIGTFTTEGTLDAAIERLDYLANLGVTHVELLPVNAFNGIWNWGYDGVLWYAVHEAYGGPDALKALVNACHLRGLAVTLDVVYNHLGPSGNCLPRFGPYLKSGTNQWGDSLNLDGEGSPEVRRYIIDNALMWLSEFHVDALRLDAVHAMHDDSVPHLLAELAERVAELSASRNVPLTLVAESDLNDPVLITPRASGGYGLDAQWDDDVHHALHALLTGERQGYYVDFGSIACLAKVLTGAFFHDGTYSTFRGRNHGEPVDREHTPGYRFVVCLQDHDQVGNRAAGDRVSELMSHDLLKVGAVLLLTSPFTPMLWMGEEWAASTRWPYFTSHPEPDLGAAVTKGRAEEFASHGWESSQVVDPQDPSVFTSAKLRWTEINSPGHADIHATYRELLSLRRANAELADPRLDQLRVDFDETARWLVVHRGSIAVVANLATQRQRLAVASSEVLFTTDTSLVSTGDAVDMPPQSAAVVRIAHEGRTVS